MLSSRGIFQASLALLRKPDLPLGGSMVSWEKPEALGDLGLAPAPPRASGTGPVASAPKPQCSPP